MKICKVRISKVVTGNMTSFSYPAGYDKNKINPFIYQNEGLATEYCLATVADDFVFTPDMVEVSAINAASIIDSWIDSDVSLVAALTSGKISESDIEEIKERKKSHIL